MGLSAIVITKNEEARLGPCLESLGFADEVVVVDSGSPDRTRQMARQSGAKVFEREFDRFDAQKNFAVSKASQDWVLSVDADERIGKALADEILSVIRRQDINCAYRVKRSTVLFGRRFCFSGLQDDKPVRLFRRDRGVFENPVHEMVRVSGPVGQLKESLTHESFQTVSQHLERLRFYTSLEPAVGARHAAPLRPTAMLARSFARFGSIYFWKRGFLDGFEGFLYAVLSGYYEFVRGARAYERTEKPGASMVGAGSKPAP